MQPPQDPESICGHQPLFLSCVMRVITLSHDLFSPVQRKHGLVQRTQAGLRNGTHLSVWHSCRPSHQWWRPWPERSLPPPAHRQLSGGGCSHRAPPETQTRQNATFDPPETRQKGLVERFWVCSPLYSRTCFLIKRMLSGYIEWFSKSKLGIENWPNVKDSFQHNGKAELHYL